MRGDKRERILRVLLTEKEHLSKNELSKQTDCSRQWVILLFKELEKKGLIKGTKIVSRRKLFEYWLNLPRKRRKYKEYMIRDILEFLKKTSLDYALTTYQAENIVQHHLFPSRVDIYIKEKDLNKWHTCMARKGLYGKGNTRIIIADSHIMYKKRKLNGLFVVSLPQLIIDLFGEGGPAQEAAEMLLKRL